MNIVIDIGNTRTKAGVFKGDQLLHQFSGSVLGVLDHLKPFDGGKVIVSAVGKGLVEVKTQYEGRMPVLVFDRQVKIPIQLHYDTPDTLGLDRVAAAIGASVVLPGKNVMVVDIGSCITIDIVEKGQGFCGGVISPGMNMRFKAMHTFTQNLPLIEVDEIDLKTVTLPALSTRACMIAGVLKAMEFEIAGHFKHYQSIYPDLALIITGGDAPYFENKFNTPIFTKVSLVLVGLNRVLEHHVA